MTRSQAAFVAMAESKMNCAQSVLTAFCEELGLDRAMALKLARGFGGGMARGGKTCGAVTGAYMVIGLHEETAGREGTEAVYTRIVEFNRKFKEIHGSTECKTLLGCDLGVPEELAKARADGFFVKLCPQFVRTAVEVLEH
jgi:C_GCAxxG_C_C family probable redox protein